MHHSNIVTIRALLTTIETTDDLAKVVIILDDIRYLCREFQDEIKED